MVEMKLNKPSKFKFTFNSCLLTNFSITQDILNTAYVINRVYDYCVNAQAYHCQIENSQLKAPIDLAEKH